ncbi:MAG TPA: hypothetical protein VMN57_12765 [Anaerolineales bacterium]|nr:hypothetical protein [Anaerolineales bacterium]
MKWLKIHTLFASDAMMLAILVWLCTLPLVGLIILPTFGANIALAAAGVIFVLVLLICWGICGWEGLRK